MMAGPVSLTLADEAATLRLGRIVAETRPDHAVIYLQGGLGAGKTTFARAFIQACGHRGIVKSPTYTLIEPYSLGDIFIYHLDLYRLSDPAELAFLGLDQLGQPGTLSLIEWPERGGAELPAADILVALTMQGDGRQAVVTAHSPAGEDWLANIESHPGPLS